MFNAITSLTEAVERFQNVQDVTQFRSVLSATQDYLKKIEMDDVLQQLETIAFYQINEYSDKNTNENIKAAADRVVQFISTLMQNYGEKTELYKILEHFDLFLECLFQRVPNAKSTIKDTINRIEIQNEYDLQHILYAYLKPIYNTERSEVSDDTGYGAVRFDIYIDSNNVIETKCTRDSMTLKSLQEEISSDITQYSAKNIYFYIYDKKKIIDNPQAFKQKYEAITKEKNVYVIILQSKTI